MSIIKRRLDSDHSDLYNGNLNVKDETWIGINISEEMYECPVRSEWQSWLEDNIKGHYVWRYDKLVEFNNANDAWLFWLTWGN